MAAKPGAKPGEDGGPRACCMTMAGSPHTPECEASWRRDRDFPPAPMGPIIQTIEAGHWDHAGKCVMCKTKYPCLPMQRAKFDQRDYSERLATRQRHDQLRIVGERRKHPR